MKLTWLLHVRSQGKYDEAKPLYERAIDIGCKTLGPDHPDLATWLENFACLLSAQVSLSVLLDTGKYLRFPIAGKVL